MTDDETLDKVVALWKEADDLDTQADLFEAEMNNAMKMANEKEDEAEELWKPLAEKHPEWFDQLRDGEDPRRAS